jgi:AAA domain/Primase C terminal 2 (PriCT-2)/Bifunctional DNA primase/polymerase, N-terminal
MRPSAGAVDPQLAKNVTTFRISSLANGYRPIRIRSASKLPVAKRWQLGETEDQLLAVEATALNTGILAAGLRCVDIDVDAPHVVKQIAAAVGRHFPPGALLRRRTNSYRLAFIYRAVDGDPTKRSIVGLHGKIEVLGSGQQFVADGTHPSGAPLYWKNGRGPDTVPRDQLPTVIEEQIGAFLEDCAQLLGAAPQVPTNVFLDQPTSQPSTMARPAGPVPNELGAGIETPNWFEALHTQEKSEAVRACLDAVDNRTDDPRGRWLRILFAVADAGRLGCPDAYDLALEWSRRGAGWTSETDFDVAWRSYKPGAIAVGTLLAAGKASGVDLSAWRDTALARLKPAGMALLGTAAAAGSAPPQHRRSVQVSALPAVPEKRQWLHGTDALRGAVTLFVASGGRGKSTWLIGLALACASGRQLLGAHVFGGSLRVLVLSAEDPTAEVARRVRAAMQHHGLSDQDVAGLHIIGANDWGLSLLRSVGNTPALDQHGWDALNAEVNDIDPDILILDPLLSLMGGVDGNNNSAAAVLMGGLVKLAADRRMAVIVAHHAAKGRDRHPPKAQWVRRRF